MSHLTLPCGFFSVLSALFTDEHFRLDQSDIDHYLAIQLALIMLCHSLSLVAMNASFIIWAIYEVKQVKLKVNGGEMKGHCQASRPSSGLIGPCW